MTGWCFCSSVIRLQNIAAINSIPCGDNVLKVVKSFTIMNRNRENTLSVCSEAGSLISFPIAVSGFLSYSLPAWYHGISFSAVVLAAVCWQLLREYLLMMWYSCWVLLFMSFVHPLAHSQPLFLPSNLQDSCEWSLLPSPWQRRTTPCLSDRQWHAILIFRIVLSLLPQSGPLILGFFFCSAGRNADLYDQSFM